MAQTLEISGVEYQIGSPNMDAVGLPVSLTDLPATLEVEGATLLRRSSFHVTLVAVGHLAARQGLNAASFVPQVLESFQRYVAKTPIAFERFTGEYRLAEEGELRSVVAMCDVGNLREFLLRVGKEFDIKPEYPPTHVTLYTLQQDAGIFLTTEEELEARSHVVTVPELRLSAN